MNTSTQTPKLSFGPPPSRDSSLAGKKPSATQKPSILIRLVLLLAGIAALLFGSSPAWAQSPPGCTGSALGINLFTDAADVHIGDTLHYSATVFNGLPGSPQIACDASDIRAFITTPDGKTNDITSLLVRRTLLDGESDFYANVASYVVRAQDIQPDGTVRATANDIGSIHQNETPSIGGGFQGVNTEVSKPCIQITVQCVGSVGENGLITFTGTVSNCGNNTLVGVTVTNNVDNGTFAVLFPTNLAKGQVATFSGSWIPMNACSPETATLVAQGVDQFTTYPKTVTSSASAACANVLAPGIRVFKSYPATPVSPGQLVVFSGSVSNTGNVTLTNIVVINNQPVANTPVFTQASLAPGMVATFTGNYPAPTNCSVSDTLTVRAASACGVQVTDTVSATSPILTTPSIEVTQSCPTAPVATGSLLAYTGTVRNSGDITLNNVVVVSDRPAANTTVFTVATLAPGASANFSGGYTVPADVCTVTANIQASAKDSCTGAAVTRNFVSTCPVGTAPAIAVTLACPAVSATTGGPITYTGTVRNSGNVTLKNVTVVNNLPEPNTVVLTVPSLAPGASANFTSSFTAPAETCSVSTTVLATGSDACANTLVSNNASATCALITTPGIVVTQDCPANPVTPGSQLVYTGTVRNSGNITLTNVVVVNDRSGSTPVFTAATMAPGASANFTGSYLAPTNCSITSTSTANGTSICGVPVSNKVSSTCSVLGTPVITVTQTCPTTPVAPGSLLAYTGTVRNAGDITLSNVVVISDRPAANTTVFSAATLAPGASANFTGSYTVPTDVCSVTANIKATAKDPCTGEAVTQAFVSTCPVATASAVAVTLACPTAPTTTGGPITYTGTVRNSGNVTLNNVTVVSTQPESGTALLTVPSLAPGASANFTANFTTPADACSITSSVTATGSDACANTLVSNSASATCTLISTPAIVVTQLCPTTPVSAGGTLTYQGTVRNTGNISLTNVVVVNGSQPGQPGPATAGLVGYWPLDETSGSVVLDGSGFANTGSIMNATRVAGRINNALSFNGANSAVLIPNTASLNFAGQITMSAWIKPLSTTGKQDIVAHGYTTTTYGSVFLRINDGRYEVGSWNNVSEPVASAPMPNSDLGNYVHLTGVYNGTSWILYRNGVVIATTETGMGSLQVNASWAIGARDAGVDRFFNGVIDEVRIYNRGLSASEVLALTTTSTPSVPGGSIFTAPRLAPGATADFSFNLPVPAGAECSIISVLTATANSTCTGSPVSDSVTTTCDLVTAPAITVTQTCPTIPVVPGGILTYSGTVSNTGNSTLRNIMVYNDRSGLTPIFTLNSLAPATSANFSGSYATHEDCCVDSSTVTASGQDCTGVTVTDTATRTCTLVTSPKIVVTKVCPPGILQPGDLMMYSGTVSNAGSITLINVTVVNNQSGNNSPVLGPIVLAPGEMVAYYASYIVPEDFCGNDTVTATGFDLCTDAPVSNSVSTTCPVMTSPRIAVTKNCPSSPTPRGGLYTFTGTVKNIGNVTLVNVFVVNNQPSNNIPVTGPITLAPGASADFTGSYIAPMDCCDILDTVTARGEDRCASTRVSATASQVCPLLSSPRLTLTQVCPSTTIPLGGLYVFSGSVQNSGDVTLTNVYVFGPQPGNSTPVLGPLELAPGESKVFTGSYTVPVDASSVTITATGKSTCSTCTECTVFATASCSAQSIRPLIGGPGVPVLHYGEGGFRLSFATQVGGAYTVQYKNPLTNSGWKSLPNMPVIGTGGIMTVTDTVEEHSACFYRLMLAPQ
jgi:uncharacterized repeat protein (TIGR01451 family)